MVLCFFNSHHCLVFQVQNPIQVSLINALRGFIIFFLITNLNTFKDNFPRTHSRAHTEHLGLQLQSCGATTPKRERRHSVRAQILGALSLASKLIWRKFECKDNSVRMRQHKSLLRPATNSDETSVVPLLPRSRKL